MTCERVTLPGGGHAIVCGSFKRQKCECGRRATLLCDWKTPNTVRKSQTCDAPLCERCSTKPAPDKDLCSRHAREFERWKGGKAVQP
ncbi:hypothetical protein ACFOON_15285 [Novosphingobium piscinae]|uniref:Uncharacterized protein n=1 Tax=Novosphingobium piscinae TaxID=1507448 RepID=A0A7X1FYI8_9SPHN|nr:hypothetical protein [Novosphingobium piscinae]MBC2668737.1 hypothetical protein [Novosphingobium piscinae]